jgi:O-antigen/teichoic acid export membrane protein
MDDVSAPDESRAGPGGPTDEPPTLPLIPYDPDPGIVDAGAVRNTVLQLVAQVATLVFSGGLTLYLVRALGARSYGVYSIAVSVGALALFPALAGLPLAVSRYVADHRDSAARVRQIYRLGLMMQIPVASLVGLVVFAIAGPISAAYGHADLVWPIRWIALSVIGQAMYGYLNAVGSSLLRSSVAMWMAITESAAEAGFGIALVAVGAGAAGAALGKLLGYVVATAAGSYLIWRIIRARQPVRQRQGAVTARSMLRYAGVMFVVDIAWSAIAQIDVLLIGALISTAAVGSFAAVLRVLTVVGYVGAAVAASIAPRLSLAGPGPDVRAFERALRYLLIVQGATIAPMIVWAHPVTELLLGSGYHSAAEIMRVLSIYSFVGAPASMITLAVTYLGEARRRLPIMVITLTLGIAATYFLIKWLGVIGAAVGDDAVIVVYVFAHFRIAATLIDIDLRSLTRSLLATIAAATAMAAVLYSIGTSELTLVDWAAGIVGGVAGYTAVLLLMGELTVAELTAVSARLLRRGRG